LLAGAIHDTTDWVDSNDVPATPVGAPAITDGITVFDGSDALLIPARFVAVTVNVYSVPLVRPVTVQVVAVVVVHVRPPGLEVTVYRVITRPPSLKGAVQLTTEMVLAADVAETFVGGPGTTPTVATADAEEIAEFPDTFVAVTLNVYVVPLVSPVTTHGFESPHANAA
jgi:hypothetical protein